MLPVWARPKVQFTLMFPQIFFTLAGQKQIFMRPTTYYFALALLLFACGGPAPEAKEVEQLSEDWDLSTARLTTRVSEISDVQERAEMALQALDSLNTAAAASAREALEAQTEQLELLSREAFGFVNEWQAGAERLHGMKTAVEEGTTSSGAEAELRALLAKGEKEQAAWAAVLQAAQAAISEAERTLEEAQ